MAAPSAWSTLLLCGALALSSGQAAAQARSNGELSWSVWPNARAATVDPPLPPGASELAYDDGQYSGNARNLQNAGIQPGWGYWALSVRFTPTASAQGQLLEARYLAPFQWSAQANFDVVVRDDSGMVLGVLPNQSATLDVVQWQVVDLRPLNLIVGNRDFTLEFRPGQACAGNNGFTLAYSLGTSGRSQASGDCADTPSSFAAESREFFLRAVVADVQATPSLQLSNLQAGSVADLELHGLSPYGRGLVLFSRQGAGPTPTAFGDLALTAPWSRLALQADANGDAQRSFPVPAASHGLSLWLQALEPSTASVGQALAVTVP